MGAFFIFGIIFPLNIIDSEVVYLCRVLKKESEKDGVVKDSAVLKVDSFLNHQMDIALFSEIGKEFYRLFCCGSNYENYNNRGLGNRNCLHCGTVF